MLHVWMKLVVEKQYNYKSIYKYSWNCCGNKVGILSKIKHFSSLIKLSRMCYNLCLSASGACLLMLGCLLWANQSLMWMWSSSFPRHESVYCFHTILLSLLYLLLLSFVPGLKKKKTVGVMEKNPYSRALLYFVWQYCIHTGTPNINI